MKKNFRILWVEDDASVIKDQVRPLEKDGCKIDIAEDMMQVLSLMEVLGEYDLLLLDILIPDGSRKPTNLNSYVGVDLLYKIRALYPDLPVIVLTVVTDPKIQEKIYLGDVRRILPKGSCLPSKLRQAVYEELGVSV